MSAGNEEFTYSRGLRIGEIAALAGMLALVAPFYYLVQPCLLGLRAQSVLLMIYPLIYIAVPYVFTFRRVKPLAYLTGTSKPTPQELMTALQSMERDIWRQQVAWICTLAVLVAPFYVLLWPCIVAERGRTVILIVYPLGLAFFAIAILMTRVRFTQYTNWNSGD